MLREYQRRIEAYRHLPPATLQSMLETTEQNLEVGVRWLTTGLPPSEDDVSIFQAIARQRADEGVPLEAFLMAYRVGGRVCWEVLLEEAQPGESQALLEVAGVAMEYLDVVSVAVAHAYLEERDQLVAEAERKAHSALAAIARGNRMSVEEGDLCRQLGLPVQDEYTPFAAVVPGASAKRHSEMARRLMTLGVAVALTEGDRITGLAWKPLELSLFDHATTVLLAVGPATRREELADAWEEVRLLLSLVADAGRGGMFFVEDFLPQLLLAQAPRLAALLRQRVHDPLGAAGHNDLQDTLAALIESDFDRARAATVLHVHRNTVNYRVGRIEKITGLRLDRSQDLTEILIANAAFVQAHNTQH